MEKDQALKQMTVKQHKQAYPLLQIIHKLYAEIILF